MHKSVNLIHMRKLYTFCFAMQIERRYTKYRLIFFIVNNSVNNYYI